MCELLGISSSRPVRAQALLRTFQKRGGETADNPDGWGLAYLHNGRFALYKEPLPAAHSQHFFELAASIGTDLLIGHVRKARLPRVNTLANTHPFRHACCGQEWVFAHNGLVPEAIEMAHRAPHLPCTPAVETADAPHQITGRTSEASRASVTSRGPRLVPIGETDSEHAFCHLLENIAQHFHQPPAAGMAPWLTALAALSGLISAHGKFNFLISDGKHLIAYGHDRLHFREHGGDGQTYEAWIATEPLTADRWQPFEACELRIYRRGRLVGRVPTPRVTALAVVTHNLSMNTA
jgi:glutamine amidotransferase